MDPILNQMDPAYPQDKPTLETRAYALKHIGTDEYICLLEKGIDYLVCTSDGDTALDLRQHLGLQEHVYLTSNTLRLYPFTHFWLDGQYIVLNKG